MASTARDQRVKLAPARRQQENKPADHEASLSTRSLERPADQDARSITLPDECWSLIVSWCLAAYDGNPLGRQALRVRTLGTVSKQLHRVCDVKEQQLIFNGHLKVRKYLKLDRSPAERATVEQVSMRVAKGRDGSWQPVHITPKLCKPIFNLLSELPSLRKLELELNGSIMRDTSLQDIIDAFASATPSVEDLHIEWSDIDRHGPRRAWHRGMRRVIVNEAFSHWTALRSLSMPMAVIIAHDTEPLLPLAQLKDIVAYDLFEKVARAISSADRPLASADLADLRWNQQIGSIVTVDRPKLHTHRMHVGYIEGLAERVGYQGGNPAYDLAFVDTLVFEHDDAWSLDFVVQRLDEGFHNLFRGLSAAKEITLPLRALAAGHAYDDIFSVLGGLHAADGGLRDKFAGTPHLRRLTVLKRDSVDQTVSSGAPCAASRVQTRNLARDQKALERLESVCAELGIELAVEAMP